MKMSVTTKNGTILTEEELDLMAEACERGEYPGRPTGEILVGRPLKFGEEMFPVTFKDTASRIEAMNARAASLDLSRSDYLRHLVSEDLKLADVG